MALSGPLVLHALDEALRDVRREEDELVRRLARSVELTIKLRQTEAELMRRLAGEMQDAEARAELTGSLTQAEVEARDLLEQHGPELESAQAVLGALDQRIAGLEDERAKLREAARTSQAALVAIAERIEAGPVEDAARVAAREAAAASARIAAGAKDKAIVAELDREQKGRAFRDDPLFMYLWQRGYGTDRYTAGGLVRSLDGWVARLTGYDAASRVFRLIGELPTRLHAYADAVQRRADDAAAELSRIEEAAIDAAGARADREAVERATTRIAEIDQDVVLLEDERDEAARLQRELAQGSEPPLSAAISSLAGALEREDVRVLLRQGRVAGQDSLVRQIDELRGRAADEDSDTRDLKGRLKILALRRRELEDIRFETKRHGFDAPHAQFDDERLATEMLNDFLRGGIGAAEYWGRLRRNLKWAETGRTLRTKQGFRAVGRAPDGTAGPPAAPVLAAAFTPEESAFSRPRGGARNSAPGTQKAAAGA